MNIEALITWFRRDRTTRLAKEKAVEDYYLYLPRTAFIKTLKASAKVLDIGAGEGSLELFREWLEPRRSDLEMYAYSLEKGNRFDAYAGYEVGNWEDSTPSFPGVTFDAIMACHFIEHISDPCVFLKWACTRLAPGGRMYLEWPSPDSLHLPPRAELLDHGVDVMISNFHDDHTHRQLPDRADLVEALLGAHWLIDTQGVVKLPFFEEELLAQCQHDSDDAVTKLFAFWSKTRWAQYVIASRPD